MRDFYFTFQQHFLLLVLVIVSWHRSKVVKPLLLAAKTFDDLTR